MHKTFFALALTLAISACTVNVNSPTTPGDSTNPSANPSTSPSSMPAGDGYDATNGLNESMTEVLDRRDQHKYPVAKIGDQYWMAQNLDYALESSRDLSDEYANFGQFYTWQEIMNGAASSESNPSNVQGICPQGWHIPSDAEWMALEQHLGMSAEQAAADGSEAERGSGFGQALKASTGWDSNAGSNSSGFNGLAAGYIDGAAAYQGDSASFWSATGETLPDSNVNVAWVRGLESEHTAIVRSQGLQDVRRSLRCVVNP